MRRSLTVVAATAVLMAVMMATMVASAGMALAAPCGSCGGPPPVPSGASNVNAFAHANPNAYDALLNNAAKRQGPKGGSGCGILCEPS